MVGIVQTIALQHGKFIGLGRLQLGAVISKLTANPPVVYLLTKSAETLLPSNLLQ